MAHFTTPRPRIDVTEESALNYRWFDEVPDSLWIDGFECSEWEDSCAPHPQALARIEAMYPGKVFWYTKPRGEHAARYDELLSAARAKVDERARRAAFPGGYIEQ